MYLWDPVEFDYSTYSGTVALDPVVAIACKGRKNSSVSLLPAKLYGTFDTMELSQLLQADDDANEAISDAQIPKEDYPISLEGISTAFDDPSLSWKENDPIPDVHFVSAALILVISYDLFERLSGWGGSGSGARGLVRWRRWLSL